MCWAEGSLCMQGEVRKTTKGLDNQCRLTAKQEHLAGSMPGKTQLPREFTRAAGHQKMLPNLTMGGIVLNCHPRSYTLGNFCKQTSFNIYMAGVHFRGCLHFRNRLKQLLITETLRLCFHNIWFPQLLTISNMQLVFALLYSPLIFFL